MAKQRVSFKLEPGECDSLKGFAKDHRLTLSAASRELVRQGLGMGGLSHDALHQLALIEKRCRRAQIAAYRAYAGVVELIRFMSKDSRIAGEILESLVEKSNDTFRKEEERGDYQ